MPRWSCARCRKFHICVELLNCIVAKQLRRIENPRMRRIEILYEAELSDSGYEDYMHRVFGVFKKDEA